MGLGVLQPYESPLACPKCKATPKPIPASACGVDAFVISCGCELGTFGIDQQQAVRRWNATVINRLLQPPKPIFGDADTRIVWTYE